MFRSNLFRKFPLMVANVWQMSRGAFSFRYALLCLEIPFVSVCSFTILVHSAMAYNAVLTPGIYFNSLFRVSFNSLTDSSIGFTSFSLNSIKSA